MEISLTENRVVRLCSRMKSFENESVVIEKIL